MLLDPFTVCGPMCMHRPPLISDKIAIVQIPTYEVARYDKRLGIRTYVDRVIDHH